ncbi:hypothetical protein CYY_001036 [Polysphondylium violaceum]|uniref:Uncharacterized protein n=1 Tax=Polysphondylium violaceum TaxID=133409 RepID=A0A8J4Q3V1_9MYCE|nr:hypothetical protein CYY_001036 [Polysphondylium violaceum]
MTIFNSISSIGLNKISTSLSNTQNASNGLNLSTENQSSKRLMCCCVGPCIISSVGILSPPSSNKAVSNSITQASKEGSNELTIVCNNPCDFCVDAKKGSTFWNVICKHGAG